MRSEGLRLDYSPLRAFLKGVCSGEQKELKALLLSFNLLRRLSLLSNFKIKKQGFKCFHGRVLTNEVQLLENSSSGMNWLLP